MSFLLCYYSNQAPSWHFPELWHGEDVWQCHVDWPWQELLALGKMKSTKVGESSKERWAGDGVQRKRQDLARGLHWGVLSDLVCPCVGHPKGRGGATERLFSKAYCGRSKKGVIVFSLDLCLYTYKCIHMYTSPFSLSDYAFKQQGFIAC